MLFTPSTRKNYGYDLFDDFFNDSFFTAPAARTTSDLMLHSIKDDGTNYLMDMELPGFKKEEIQAELKDGYLTICATHNDNQRTKRCQWQANPSGTLYRLLQKKLLCRRGFETRGYQSFL